MRKNGQRAPASSSMNILRIHFWVPVYLLPPPRFVVVELTVMLEMLNPMPDYRFVFMDKDRADNGRSLCRTHVKLTVPVSI